MGAELIAIGTALESEDHTWKNFNLFLIPIDKWNVLNMQKMLPKRPTMLQKRFMQALCVRLVLQSGTPFRNDQLVAHFEKGSQIEAPNEHATVMG